MCYNVYVLRKKVMWIKLFPCWRVSFGRFHESSKFQWRKKKKFVIAENKGLLRIFFYQWLTFHAFALLQKYTFVQWTKSRRTVGSTMHANAGWSIVENGRWRCNIVILCQYIYQVDLAHAHWLTSCQLSEITLYCKVFKKLWWWK